MRPIVSHALNPFRILLKGVYYIIFLGICLIIVSAFFFITTITLYILTRRSDMNSFQRKPITVFMILFAALLLIILLNSGLSSVSSQDIPPNTTETESIIDPYIEVRSESLTIIHRTYTDGSITDTYQFNGPYSPPEEYAEDIAATIFNGVVINGETVPRYTWVLGCTATAGSMIAAYYDRTSFPNIHWANKQWCYASIRHCLAYLV